MNEKSVFDINALEKLQIRNDGFYAVVVRVRLVAPNAEGLPILPPEIVGAWSQLLYERLSRALQMAGQSDGKNCESIPFISESISFFAVRDWMAAGEIIRREIEALGILDHTRANWMGCGNSYRPLFPLYQPEFEPQAFYATIRAKAEKWREMMVTFLNSRPGPSIAEPDVLEGTQIVSNFFHKKLTN